MILVYRTKSAPNLKQGCIVLEKTYQDQARTRVLVHAASPPPRAGSLQACSGSIKAGKPDQLLASYVCAPSKLERSDRNRWQASDRKSKGSELGVFPADGSWGKGPPRSGKKSLIMIDARVPGTWIHPSMHCSIQS